MRIAFYTLGCKVNQYETQALEQLAQTRGHTLVPFEGEADAYVINTCTVTAVSDKKSRQMIRRARKRAPEALVAVCGHAKYRQRLTLAAGETPALSLKLKPGEDVLEDARNLVEDLKLAAEESAAAASAGSTP